MIPDTMTADTRTIHTLQATAWWLYLFHAVCFLLTLGILSFVPLVLNYLARPKAAHTFVYSHHTWQIRSFWWYIVWGCVGSVLYVTFIGIPGALIAKSMGTFKVFRRNDIARRLKMTSSKHLQVDSGDKKTP